MRSLLVAALVAAPFAFGVASAAPADDAARGHEVVTVADPAIVESSGLVVGGGLAVTMNDSGDDARVFTIDLRSGDTVGTTRFGSDATDLESLAPAGDGRVWVGDTGDNGKDRKDVEVTRVPVGPGDRTVEGETFHLRYPNGARDAEALLAHPATGRLYLVTKAPMGGTVYAAPERLDPDRPNTLTAIGDAPALVTDGAFHPDGTHLVLRTYFDATVLTFPGLEPVAAFGLPEQQQGEGLAISGDGSVYLSSEGANQPILRLDLPSSAADALAGKVKPSAGPAPSTPALPTSPPSASDGSGDDGSGQGPWVPVVFGGLGLLLVGGLVLALRSR